MQIPADVSKKKLFAVVIAEGMIAGLGISLWLKKQFGLPHGWDWAVGISIAAVHAPLFNFFPKFRIGALVVAVPLVAIIVYEFAAELCGIAGGVVFATIAAVITCSIHLVPESGGDAPRKLIRGAGINTFASAKARSAALLRRSSKK